MSERDRKIPGHRHRTPEERRRAAEKLDQLIRKAESNMSVRAKMVLSSITAHSWSADSKTLKFSTLYDGTTPEDQRFQKATPSGAIEMQVDNPAAIAQFALGKAYYVDFTEA